MTSATSWREALHGQDVESAFRLWCEDSETYLTQRSGTALEREREKFQGRGRPLKLRKHTVAAPQASAQLGAAPLQQRRILKTLRRAEELARRRAHTHVLAGTNFALESLWGALVKGGSKALPGSPWAAWWRLESPPGLQQAKALVTALQEEARKQEADLHHERVRAWRQWVREDWIGKKSGTYKWCKNVQSERTTLLERPDGTLTGNCQEMDELLREA